MRSRQSPRHREHPTNCPCGAGTEARALVRGTHRFLSEFARQHLLHELVQQEAAHPACSLGRLYFRRVGLARKQLDYRRPVCIAVAGAPPSDRDRCGFNPCRLHRECFSVLQIWRLCRRYKRAERESRDIEEGQVAKAKVEDAGPGALVGRGQFRNNEQVSCPCAGYVPKAFARNLNAALVA